MFCLFLQNWNKTYLRKFFPVILKERNNLSVVRAWSTDQLFHLIPRRVQTWVLTAGEGDVGSTMCVGYVASSLCVGDVGSPSCVGDVFSTLCEWTCRSTSRNNDCWIKIKYVKINVNKICILQWLADKHE